MIKETVRNFFSLFGIEIRRNKLLQGNKLNAFLIPPEEWEKRSDGYYLKILDVVVADRNSPLITGYVNAKRIAKFGGRFFFDQQKCLQLEIGGVFFFIQFPDELFVVNEVFISGDYNFNTTEQVVIVDVGLNIGVTSLFYAQQPNVQKVYAYEIFPETYQSALRNLKLNQAFKVESFNFGLGDANKELELEYSFQNKARMGLSGLPKNETFEHVDLVKVMVKDVAEEFSSISKQAKGFRKICKMDCEGSEFEILNRLFEQKAINLMDVYLIEWHDFDTEVIIRNFLSNGFEIIKTISGNPLTGLIYAIKR